MARNTSLKGPIVECVPNFSEGMKSDIIQSIVNEIASTRGIKVLDINSDPDHNRSVVTFLGKPQAVVDAALSGVRAASRLIDLRKQKGVHPRLGAADVVPLIPIRGIEMNECVLLARKLAKRIWHELMIPTYLYGFAALREERQRLEKVRLKGFEQMRELVEIDEDKRPDFGEPKLHTSAGATIVGAREPLIAFNVNLKSGDVSLAREIATAVREKNSGLMGVKALGLMLESKSCVQISTNITKTDAVSPHAVYERISEEAEKRGVEISSSELIGLMPLRAVLSSIREDIKLDSLETDKIIELNL